METSDQLSSADSAATRKASDAEAAVRAVVQTAYPSLTEAERSVAEANLLRYLEIAIRIAERLPLTAPESLLSMNERSKSNFQT